MGKDYAEYTKLKIFRQGTKFLSGKMAEKSRIRELSTTKNAGKCHIGDEKKATNFGLKLFNGTCFQSFLQIQRNHTPSERRADCVTSKTKFTFKIFRMA